jgi:hypothetical protein
MAEKEQWLAQLFAWKLSSSPTSTACAQHACMPSSPDWIMAQTAFPDGIHLQTRTGPVGLRQARLGMDGNPSRAVRSADLRRDSTLDYQSGRGTAKSETVSMMGGRPLFILTRCGRRPVALVFLREIRGFSASILDQHRSARGRPGHLILLQPGITNF